MTSAALTPREREIVALLLEGLMPQEIADHLGISVRTARHHLEHILLKLPAGKGRAQFRIVRWAQDMGNMSHSAERR